VPAETEAGFQNVPAPVLPVLLIQKENLPGNRLKNVLLLNNQTNFFTGTLVLLKTGSPL